MSKKIISKATDDNRSIVDLFVEKFGVPKKVRTHYDEPETSTIHIFNAPDCPNKGVTTYASIGVSDVPLFVKKKKQTFGLEILIASNTEEQYAANILSTACFCIMKDSWECYPGAVFPDIFSMYHKQSALKHGCFVDPFLWESSFQAVQLSKKKVAFLQLIGIAEQEYQHIEQFGFESLAKIFSEKEIDVLDFKRPSAV
jgi:antitoxin YqcF